jgi:hypothetical protein
LNLAYSVNGTYTITNNGVTRQVNFTIPPKVGVKNITISGLVIDNSTTGLSHVVGATVLDSGKPQLIPGGYTWEPTSNGLQRSRSAQALFLLDRAGLTGK